MAFLVLSQCKRIGSYCTFAVVKKRTMENIRTIAVIGASEERNFSILKELSERYHLLLFDNNKQALTDIHESLVAQNRHGEIEKMDCALSASWEADIIILSGFCVNDAVVVEKIKEVATAKIIIIMENDDDFTKSINSKIVEIINVATDDNAEKEFLLEGHHSKALDTVAGIFDRCGFTTFVSQFN
jgi:hypothetical protein